MVLRPQDDCNGQCCTNNFSTNSVKKQTTLEFFIESGQNKSLIGSFLLHKANRYDLKGKTYLRTLEKYYLGDLGFRYWLSGKDTGDIGRRIENLVYLKIPSDYSQVSF